MKKCPECGTEHESENCPQCFPPSSTDFPADDPAPEAGAVDPAPAPSDPPPPAAPEAPEGLDAIFSELAGKMPEAEKFFVDEMQAEEKAHQAEKLKWHKTKDRKGFYFDPEKCQTNADGSPKLTKTGLFDLKKGVSREDLPKRPKLPKDTLPEVAEGLETEAAAAAAETEQSAAVLVSRAKAQANAILIDTVFWTGCKLPGMPFAPEVIAPTQKAISPTAVAILAEELEKQGGGPDLPWWLPLTVIYGTALVSMAQHQASRPRLEKFKEKVGILWHRIKNRKKAPKGE